MQEYWTYTGLHVKVTKLDALSRIHVKTPPTKTPPLFTKTPPLFFQNKNYFIKTPPPLYWQNSTFNYFFLLKRWYHVWYLLIQNLSSKFIYCIYMFILHQTTTNLYIYILYTPVIVSYPFVFIFFVTIKYRLILTETWQLLPTN